MRPTMLMTELLFHNAAYYITITPTIWSLGERHFIRGTSTARTLLKYIYTLGGYQSKIGTRFNSTKPRSAIFMPAILPHSQSSFKNL